MADTLEIFGVEYTNVAGIIATDDNGDELTFTRGGGGSKQEVTGTVNGSGGTTLQISCSFAPNLIYIYGDMSGSVSNRGIVSVTILKDSELLITNDGSTSSANETLFHYDHSITDYGIVSEPHATYSNGVLTVDVIADSSSSRFNSSITYNYKLVGWS